MNLTNPCVCWWCLLIDMLPITWYHARLSHTRGSSSRQPPSWNYFHYSKTVLYREWMNLTNPCVCWWCLLIHALHHLIPCTALTHMWQQDSQPPSWNASYLDGASPRLTSYCSIHNQSHFHARCAFSISPSLSLVLFLISLTANNS